MKRVVITAAFILVACLAAALISAVFGLQFWWTFLLVAAGVLANGLVAIFEDDLPGGFNNPAGTHTPKYVGRTVFAIRTLTAIFILLICLALGLFFWG
jgi:hypothetical protein